MTVCVICEKEIEETEYGWDKGNNASPLAEGRCCDWCNINKVLPYRLSLIRK